MKLLYISQENLKNQNFIKLLVSNFKPEDTAILLHESFGDKAGDTRFVTKRISSLLSDNYIPNNAFSGDQRGILSVGPDGKSPRLRTAFLNKMMQGLPVLVLNCLTQGDVEPSEAEPLEVARLIRSEFPVKETVVFTQNPLSPLGTKGETITTQADLDRLLALYEEEKGSLELAMKLAPARIASPTNFSQS